MTHTPNDMFATLHATWPAARVVDGGAFVLRDGADGGKRASAATAKGAWDDAAIADAEIAMRDMGARPLFMIRPEDEALDAALAARGYDVLDPSVIYGAPVADLMAERPPRTVAIRAWEPLRIMEEIWDAGGTTAARRAVMHRVSGPKTGFVSRWRDSPAAAAFAAAHGGIVMVHALEVMPHQRREGVGRWVMQGAAFWGADQECDTIAVACMSNNEAACGLYENLGMTEIARYHYRVKT